MAHKFVLIVDGVLTTYTKYEDIPESFNRVIEFKPEIPDGPHTDEQHEEIEQWGQKLLDLIKRETR